MRLATFNVNGLRARLDFLLAWLAERKPDVVGLQELKLTEDQFPRLELEAAGYHAEIHGQKSWNGVAVLSRERGSLVQAGLPGREERGARLLTVEVNGIWFSTVYVPNGKSVEHADFPEKLAWLDALRAHLDERHDPSRPEVLCGDFNIVPQPIDSWNEAKLKGHVFHTDEERARFRALLDWGFVDLFRERYPDKQAFSWWDYRAGAFHKKQGLRIDAVLGTRAIAERMTGAEIDREWRKKQNGLTASDHAPVWVDVE